MGFGGRIINQLRASIGLDTLADEMDRKNRKEREGIEAGIGAMICVDVPSESNIREKNNKLIKGETDHV